MKLYGRQSAKGLSYGLSIELSFFIDYVRFETGVTIAQNNNILQIKKISFCSTNEKVNVFNTLELLGDLKCAVLDNIENSGVRT